jgi:hypothetical protein
MSHDRPYHILRRGTIIQHSSTMFGASLPFKKKKKKHRSALRSVQIKTTIGVLALVSMVLVARW